MSVCLFVLLVVCLPVCTSVYLSVCLSVRMSACLATCMPACLSVCLSACLPFCLSVCLINPCILIYYILFCLFQFDSSGSASSQWSNSQLHLMSNGWNRKAVLKSILIERKKNRKGWAVPRFLWLKEKKIEKMEIMPRARDRTERLKVRPWKGKTSELDSYCPRVLKSGSSMLHLHMQSIHRHEGCKCKI